MAGPGESRGGRCGSAHFRRYRNSCVVECHDCSPGCGGRGYGRKRNRTIDSTRCAHDNDWQAGSCGNGWRDHRSRNGCGSRGQRGSYGCRSSHWSHRPQMHMDSGSGRICGDGAGQHFGRDVATARMDQQRRCEPMVDPCGGRCGVCRSPMKDQIGGSGIPGAVLKRDFGLMADRSVRFAA